MDTNYLMKQFKLKVNPCRKIIIIMMFIFLRHLSSGNFFSVTFISNIPILVDSLL